MNANWGNSSPKSDGEIDSVKPSNYQSDFIGAPQISGNKFAKQTGEMTPEEKFEYEAWKRQLKPVKKETSASEMAQQVLMSQTAVRAKEPIAPMKEKMSAESAVRSFLEKQIASDPSTHLAKLQNFNLVHINRNNFRGSMTLKAAGEMAVTEFEVTYDGENINFTNFSETKTHNSTMKQMILVLLLALIIGALIWQITRVVANPGFVSFAGLAICSACFISVLVNFIKATK